MDIKINSYIPQTKVEGPGTRFCIWVQGCSIKCKGCANSAMWNKEDGIDYDVKDIVGLIKSYSNDIEGITFLGGEPLDQIEAIIYISQEVQKMGLSVVVFSGYEFETIKKHKAYNELKNCIDILIDGRFEEENLDYSRPWVGSSNQNYYFFSDTYNENILNEYTNKIEIRIEKDNQISLNGMGNYKAILDNV